MNLDYNTMMYIQLILETLIIILLLTLILKKNKNITSFQNIINIKETLESTLKEAEQSSNRLLSTMKEKEIFSINLINELNDKIEEYKSLLKNTDDNENDIINNQNDFEFRDNNNKNVTETTLKPDATSATNFKIKEMILEMHKDNRPLDEIANKTGLHLSEIELIINYAKSIK